jgi:hypothetical protein
MFLSVSDFEGKFRRHTVDALEHCLHLLLASFTVNGHPQRQGLTQIEHHQREDKQN